MTTTTTTPTSQQAAWPLFDLFLDLPHPAASPKCPPHFIIKPPDDERSEIVIKEMGDDAAIARIARFAFPEHDDRAPKPPAPKAGGAGLNRHDVYWIQHKGFASHTFSLQLSDGVRVHGHVRRYLPLHLEAKSRWDVGRRGVRAMVLLSRAAGGDLLFDSVLKSVEGISSQQSATPPELHPSSSPQSAFLKALHKNHVAICNAHAQKPNDKRAPMVLTLQGAEFGNVPKFLEVDSSRFLLPTSLMQLNTGISAAVVAPMLPLLRALGVPNALRVMSALLSERRVLMTSASPTRLTNCARSALAMLAQGLLHWQHLFIPVLPPHLMQYLAAPMPYLIGILTNIASQLDQVQEIGEVLIIHLDSNQMETRGMQATQVLQKIPDLCGRTMLEDPNTGYQQTLSASEELARGLTDILKSDKRAMSGDSAFQEGTKEAVKKVGRAFGKLKEKGRAYLQKQSNSTVSEPKTPPNEPASVPDEVNHQEASYIYTESCLNEAAEEEVRIAITVFFLCMIGDLRWFLTQQQAGQPPVLDRTKFIQSKRALGDVEGTPIYPLLQNFVQTQMFEQFAKTRVEQVSQKQVPARDAPLFARCAYQHRVSRMDFTFGEVRRMARELAQTSPSRFLIQSNATARRLAMSLTSNTAFAGDYQEALTRLTESCREASSVLFDVMSVVWMRLRDSKGMQWKHGLYSLHIIRNLILHGPLAAVAEATDGLDKIRLFQSYTDSLRTKQAQQIRSAATQVYKLLVDRAMLFAARRVCANSRRLMKHPPQGRLTRDARLRVTLPFKSIHAAMAPSGHRPSVAPVAPPPPKQPSPATRAGPPQQQQQAQRQQQRPQPQQQVNPVVDLLGMSPSSEPGHTIQQMNQQSNSVLGGMMDQMTVSGGGGGGVPKDPFTTSSNSGGPTYAQIPPKQQQQQYSQPTFAQIPPPAQQQQPTSTAPLFAQQQQQQPKTTAAPAPAFPQQQSKGSPTAPPAFAQQPPAPAFAQQPKPAPAPAYSPQPAAVPAFAQQPKPATAPAFAQQQQPLAPAQPPKPTYAQIPKTAAPTYAPQQQAPPPPQRTLTPAVYAQQAPGGGYAPQAYNPQQQQQGAAYPSYSAPQQRPPYQQQQAPPPPAYAPQQQQQAGAPPQQQQYVQPTAPGTNLFIAAPPAATAPAPPQQQQQQQAAPPSNVNKFDPMRRDPFA